ncbi:hypothetical protein D3C71_1988490 [compost metagenome]
MIPQGSPVVAFRPDHHQPCGIQWRFAFQITAKLGRQHWGKTGFHSGAIFLLRSRSQVAQPTGTHLKTFTVLFRWVDIKIGGPAILLNHRDQRLILVIHFSKYV